jgi:hypothetical protein
MAADILAALRERGGQKGKPSVMKRPAASLGTSDAESPPPAKKPLAKQLAAQGAAPEQLKENPPTGKLPPMRIDQATIYFNCAKECWRVKLRLETGLISHSRGVHMGTRNNDENNG